MVSGKDLTLHFLTCWACRSAVTTITGIHFYHSWLTPIALRFRLLRVSRHPFWFTIARRRPPLTFPVHRWHVISAVRRRGGISCWRVPSASTYAHNQLPASPNIPLQWSPLSSCESPRTRFAHLGCQKSSCGVTLDITTFSKRLSPQLIWWNLFAPTVTVVSVLKKLLTSAASRLTLYYHHLIALYPLLPWHSQKLWPLNGG